MDRDWRLEGDLELNTERQEQGRKPKALFAVEFKYRKPESRLSTAIWLFQQEGEARAWFGRVEALVENGGAEKVSLDLIEGAIEWSAA